MSIRRASRSLAFAPIRIGLIIVGSIVGLLAISAAVKPEMAMSMLHALVPM